MSRRLAKLTNICPIQLGEVFDNIFELHRRLGLSDEDLLSTTRLTPEDDEGSTKEFKRLLEVYNKARDRLIIWYLKYNLVEVNVTISLLTAKIKLIEYKLGRCDGLDLHQACSLSLVDFCNILADKTILTVEPGERKTMHKISQEANVPVWLSHYRNQICHVPSESPCISILVPLIASALEYMRNSFWVKLASATDTLDEERCRSLVATIAKKTNIIVRKKKLRLREPDQESSQELTKASKRSELATSSTKCRQLRKLLLQHPTKVLDILIEFMISSSPSDETKNFTLLLEQIILACQFEGFVLRLIESVDYNRKYAWLRKIFNLVCAHKGDKRRKSLRQLGLSTTLKMKRYTNIPPLKCCHIAYKLMEMEHSIGRKLVIRMRHKLLPVLGKQRTLLMLRLTRLARV